MWKLSIENRGNNFSLNAQRKMFISWQTFEGYKIATNAIAEVTKFYCQRVLNLFLRKGFARMKLRNTLVARDNWVDVLIIQIYKYLGIMTTHSYTKKCIL